MPRRTRTVTVDELQKLRNDREQSERAADGDQSPADDANLYPVPVDTAFGSGDVMPAPDLDTLARDLIETSGSDLEWLRTIKIAYRWVRKGGASGGHRTLGQTLRPSKLWRADTRSQMVIWLAADTLRELRVERLQVEAILFERLCAIDRDESGRIRRGAPDFTGYKKAVRRFGAYTAELQAAADAFATGPSDVRNERLPFDDDAATDTDEDVAASEDPGDASYQPAI